MIDNINLELKRWDWKRQTVEGISVAALIWRIEWWAYKTKPVKVQLDTVNLSAYWFTTENLFDFAVHCRIIEKANLKYPVIINSHWYIIDWRHRLIKAILKWKKEIDWIMIMDNSIINDN